MGEEVMKLRRTIKLIESENEILKKKKEITDSNQLKDMISQDVKNMNAE